MSNAKISISRPFIAEKGEYFSSLGDHAMRWLTTALDRLLDHLEQRRERAALAQMDDRALKDIGLTRTDLAAPQKRDRA